MDVKPCQIASLFDLISILSFPSSSDVWCCGPCHARSSSFLLQQGKHGQTSWLHFDDMVSPKYWYAFLSSYHRVLKRLEAVKDRCLWESVVRE